MVMHIRSLEHATDAAVIRHSLATPPDFTLVFDRHFDAVHGYAQRRVGPDLAEEIAAETFARAFDRRRRYDFRHADARPWLLGIATNILRRHWRSERRRLDAYRRAASEGRPHELPAALGQEIVDALDSLPGRERDALLLLAWGDLTYEEIAVALDVPVGTVRSRLARARRRMRDVLGSPSQPNPSLAAKESTHV